STRSTAAGRSKYSATRGVSRSAASRGSRRSACVLACATRQWSADIVVPVPRGLTDRTSSSIRGTTHPTSTHGSRCGRCTICHRSVTGCASTGVLLRRVPGVSAPAGRLDDERPGDGSLPVVLLERLLRGPPCHGAAEAPPAQHPERPAQPHVAREPPGPGGLLPGGREREREVVPQEPDGGPRVIIRHALVAQGAGDGGMRLPPRLPLGSHEPLREACIVQEAGALEAAEQALDGVRFAAAVHELAPQLLAAVVALGEDRVRTLRRVAEGVALVRRLITDRPLAVRRHAVCSPICSTVDELRMRGDRVDRPLEGIEQFPAVVRIPHRIRSPRPPEPARPPWTRCQRRCPPERTQ